MRPMPICHCLASHLFLHQVENPARRGDDQVDFLVDPHDIVLQVGSAWMTVVKKDICFDELALSTCERQLAVFR